MSIHYPDGVVEGDGDIDFVQEDGKCYECGGIIQAPQINKNDDVPLCKNCKYIDFCDVCGSEGCYCDEEE